jgi:polysaccharide export outer membrane protein
MPESCGIKKFLDSGLRQNDEVRGFKSGCIFIIFVLNLNLALGANGMMQYYKAMVIKTMAIKTMVIVGTLAIIAGCAGAPNLPAQSSQNIDSVPSILVKVYKMSVGDQVKVNVWKNPELSITAPIRPDGKIAIPLIGDVLAAGKEPEKLAKDIEIELAGFVKNPNVTVILTSLKGHEFLSRIRVTGAVARNMSINYQPGMTVLDAVLEAGSVTVYADSNQTKLHRRDKDKPVSYDIRLEDIIQNGDLSTNIYLMPGDVITVPESIF